MKYAGFLIICLILTKSSISQSIVLSNIPLSGKDIYSFIPKGYDTITTASGDLNNDQVADIAVVIGSSLEANKDLSFDEMDSLPGRLLILLLKESNGWRMAAASQSAVLCKNCGGVFGDPFAGIAIQNGILEIYHYGGSNWRWSYTHKFRYQKNDFYLIGQTTISYWDVEMCEKLDEFAGTEYEDINFLTGQFQRKKVSAEGCKLLENKKGKRAIKPLISLSKFSIDK